MPSLLMSTTDWGNMALLMIISEVDLPILSQLLDCRSDWHYHFQRKPAPCTPWFNSTPSLPVECSGVCTGVCGIAVEVAEEHFVFLQRLLSATNHGFRDWWRLAARSGAFNMKVILGQQSKKMQFVVKLPRVREKGEGESLLLAHRVEIENVTVDWSVKARMGLSYVIGRALLRHLNEVGVWEKVRRAKKGQAIERLTELTTKSLLRGKRIFKVAGVDWTKEFGRLVRRGWGWEGVFNVREENGGCAKRNRCVVVHLDPVYITVFEQRKQPIVVGTN